MAAFILPRGIHIAMSDGAYRRLNVSPWATGFSLIISVLRQMANGSEGCCGS